MTPDDAVLIEVVMADEARARRRQCWRGAAPFLFLQLCAAVAAIAVAHNLLVSMIIGFLAAQAMTATWFAEERRWLLDDCLRKWGESLVLVARAWERRHE